MKIFGQLEKAVIENLGADPTGAGLVEGRIWFRTDLDVYKAYANGVVVEFADLATAQTFVNKTLTSPLITDPEINGATTYDQIATPTTPASTKHKVYFKSDGLLYTLNDAGEEVPVGSGAGGLGKNYVLNPDADINAGDTDVTANVTLVKSATDPLRGTHSFLMTYSSSATVADYAEWDMDPIEIADLGKDLILRFDYSGDSGVSTNDFEVYLYDVTAATEYPLRDKELSYTGDLANSASFTGRVSLHDSNTNYKIRIKPSFSFGTARQLKVDNIIANTDIDVPGYIGSNWNEYTPVLSSDATPPTKGTTTLDRARWRRVGEEMEIVWEYVQTVAGTAGSGNYTFSLPSGYTIDSSKLNTAFSFPKGACGSLSVNAGGNIYQGTCLAASSTTLWGIFANTADAAGGLRSWSATNLAFNNATYNFTFTVKVPIAEWAGKATNLISTTENMFKNVDVRGSGNGSEVIAASVTPITFNEVSDNTNSWNGSQFTAPEDGKYQISGSIYFTTTITTLIHAFVDTVGDILLGGHGSSSTVHNFNGEIYLTRGQVLEIRSSVGGTLNNGNATRHWLSISQVKDTSVFSVYGESELIESLVPGGAWPLAGSVAGDVTSITLTKGEWDLSFNSGGGTGSTSGTGNTRFFIGTIAGNNLTEYIEGENGLNSVFTGTFSHNDLSLPKYNVIINATTTFYLKAWSQGGSISGFTIHASKISARRIK